MAKKLFYRYYIDVMFEEQVAGRVLVLDTFYLGPVGVFVIGLYIGYKMILTLQGIGEKPGKFLHNLIRDILHTMILCTIGYAYFYMLVMLLAEDVYVSAVISGLFAIWLSVVILTGDNADKIKYRKIISIITGLMILLVFLQGCDMDVRIYRYGMRPERYVGMVLFLFEICAMLVHYYGKGKYGKLLPLFGMLVVITFYVPCINMNSVSNRWQMSLLKKYYQAVCDKEVISRSAYERLKDSYDYLSWWAWAKMDDKMDKEIEDYDIYEKNFVVKLKQQYPEADLTQSDYHIILCSHMAEEVEDSGYSYTSWLKQNSCYVKEEDGGIAVDFSAFQFIRGETGEIITADISELIENAIEYEKEYPYVSGEQCSEAMKKYSCIELDDDTVLYINECEVVYDDGVKNAEPYFKWCIIDISAKLCQY
ncbi:MAG: DUF4153 domain-containing protein [Bacillus sp. (in: Bacteria)]|nr:DUF4153 domain-containing protein [Bacillus sp. (in: firmicutes)]MCM1428133.1 DUF4153 domain-containing protein [Eubacterium sp.]